MVFNYFMFRRHVFRDSRAAVLPYIAAYAVNYGLSLVTLAVLNRVLESDYLAGFLSIVFVALVNFVVLKFLVFLPRSTGT
jgi:putative flippase GtrA